MHLEKQGIRKRFMSYFKKGKPESDASEFYQKKREDTEANEGEMIEEFDLVMELAGTDDVDGGANDETRAAVRSGLIIEETTDD